MCAGGHPAFRYVQPESLLSDGTGDRVCIYLRPVLSLLSHSQQGNLAFHRHISQTAVDKDNWYRL